MQVKSIAECSRGEHSAVFLTIFKLPHGLKTFVFSLFKRLLKTGFTVYAASATNDDADDDECVSRGFKKMHGFTPSIPASFFPCCFVCLF